MAGKRRGRGEGGVQPLAGGGFRAWLSAGKDAAGKRVRLSAVRPTKREALEWLRARQAEQASGRPAAAGRMTVGEWLTRWLDSKRPAVEPETWNWYERRVRLHLRPTVGGLPLAKLDKLAVEAMHAELTRRGASPSEQHKAATTLRAALAEAVEAGLVAVNHAKRVKKPRVNRLEMKCLDAGQAGRLLAAARETPWYAFFAAAVDTGMRPGELFGLHWDAVDLDAGAVRVDWTLENIAGRLRLKRPKTEKSRRVIRIADATAVALAELRRRTRVDASGGPVFRDSRGGRLQASNFRAKVFLPLLKAAALPHIRLYDLRHTSATLLLSRDVNVRVVSERLGHESIEITLKHYAHILPTMQERAVTTLDGLFGEWHATGTGGRRAARAGGTQDEE